MQSFSQYRVQVKCTINDLVCQPGQLLDAEDINPGSFESAVRLGLIVGVEDTEAVEDTELPVNGTRRPRAQTKRKVEPDPIPEPPAETETTAPEPGSDEPK